MNNSKQEDSFKLYSKTRTASLLGIGKSKLETLLSSGQLKHMDVNGKIRIPRQAISDYIKNGLDSSIYPAAGYDLSDFIRA